MGVEKRKWVEEIFRRLNEQVSVTELGVENERRKNQGPLQVHSVGG